MTSQYLNVKAVVMIMMSFNVIVKIDIHFFEAWGNINPATQRYIPEYLTPRPLFIYVFIYLFICSLFNGVVSS
jgi:hypothetical protein